RDGHVGTEGVERPAGQVEDPLHAEDHLQPRGDQEQDRRVEHPAQEDVERAAYTFQLLIQSKSLAPAGFMILVVDITSTGSMVTKSYLFLCVVTPWKKLHIWIWSSRQLRLPESDSISRP